MTKESFLSADNKTDVACYFYDEIVGEPKAIVQISHGMQEHMGRYSYVVRALNQNGYIVCGNDHLGHGATSKCERTDGFFANKHGDRFVLEDLHTMTMLAKTRYPNLPLIMFGHSMGSFFARWYATVYGNELYGLIVSGTSYMVKGIRFGIFLTNVLGLLKGKKYKMKFLEKIATSQYFLRVNEVKTGKEWITSNKSVLEDYLQDDRCGFVFSLQAYHDMLSVLKRINTKKWFSSYPKTLPTYIFSGKDDPVGNYGIGVTKVYNLLRNEKVNDLVFKLYDGCRHEVYNEVTNKREECVADLNFWLDKRYGSNHI